MLQFWAVLLDITIMERTLQDFEPYSTELTVHDQVTGLENIGIQHGLREARTSSNRELLEISKSALLDYLLKNSAQAVLVDRAHQGKRYVVFSINNCYVKVLISEGRYSVLPPDRVDLERVLTRHAIEHAAVARYFNKAVPDTLFF